MLAVMRVWNLSGEYIRRALQLILKDAQDLATGV